MDKSVDFYFDVGSPAAYLAWTQLPALCHETGATLNYRPMLLGGVFQATGNRPPISVPLKGSYPCSLVTSPMVTLATLRLMPGRPVAPPVLSQLVLPVRVLLP